MRNKTHFLPDRWQQEISSRHLSFLRWKLFFSFVSLCSWNSRNTGRLPSPLCHLNLEANRWDEVWTQPKWFISQVAYVQKCPTRISSCAQLLGTSCPIPDPLYTLLHHDYNQRDLGWTQSWVENLDRQENCRPRKSQWPDLPQSVSQGLLCGSTVEWGFLPSHFFSTSHCLVLLLQMRKQEVKSPCSGPQALPDSAHRFYGGFCYDNPSPLLHGVSRACLPYLSFPVQPWVWNQLLIALCSSNSS